MATFCRGKQSGGVYLPPWRTSGFSRCTRSMLMGELNSMSRRPTARGQGGGTARDTGQVTVTPLLGANSEGDPQGGAALPRTRDSQNLSPHQQGPAARYQTWVSPAWDHREATRSAQGWGHPPASTRPPRSRPAHLT